MKEKSKILCPFTCNLMAGEDHFEFPLPWKNFNLDKAIQLFMKIDPKR